MFNYESPHTSDLDPHCFPDEEQIGLHALQKMLAQREKGVSGPERKGAAVIAKVGHVMPMLDKRVRDWPGAITVCVKICQQLNKLIDRERLDPSKIEDLSIPIAAALDEVVPAFGYPKDEDDWESITRLVLNNSIEDVLYYASPKFIEDMQAIANEMPELQSAIGSYLTKQELLRRAQFTRKPIEDTRDSVFKSVEICRDKESYITRLVPGGYDRRYIRALLDSEILKVVARAPRAFDDVLARSAVVYTRFAAEFPLFAELDSWGLVHDITHRGKAIGLDNLKKDAAAREALLRRAYAERPHDTLLRSYICRGSTSRSFEDLVAMSNRARAMAPLADSRRGKMTNVKETALTLRETPYLVDEDYNALDHGTGEYRAMMYEVVTAPAITTPEKIAIFENIRTIRQNAKKFTNALRPALGPLSDAIYGGIDQRITEILYTVKYYNEHENELITVPMGSKNVEVSVSPNDILGSLRLLKAATDSLARIELAPQATTNQHVLEAGYVGGTNDKVLLLTKTRHDTTHSPLVRGRSARMNFVVSVADGLAPSTTALEREQNSLSIRLDLDSGELVVDIGGKTTDPNTPDFLVAKCISLGAWQRGLQKGIDGQDYHISLGAITDAEFERVTMLLREKIEFSPTALPIPHELR